MAGVQVFDRLCNLANVLGVMVTGGLIATTVKLKLAVQFACGEGDPLVLQDQRDKGLPFLLPVGLTCICDRLLKQGPGKNSAPIITGRYNVLERPWGPIEPVDVTLPACRRANGNVCHITTDHGHSPRTGGEGYLQ